MRRGASLHRPEAGQASADYLGVLVFVAAVCVLLIATGPARAIADGIKEAICRIVSGDCGDGATSPVTPSGEPATPCIVHTEDGRRDFSLSVGVFKLGDDHFTAKEQHSDDTVTYTAGTVTEAGLTTGAGGGVELNLGRSTVGGRAELRVEGGPAEESAQTWTLPNAQAAEKFDEDLMDELNDLYRMQLMAGGGGPGAGFGASLTFSDARIHQMITEELLGEPDKYYVAGGGHVAASFSARAGVAYATVEAEGALYLGQERDPADNPSEEDLTTHFFKVDLGGEAGAGANFLAGAGLEGTGEVVVAMVTGADGRAREARVSIDGQISGSLDYAGRRGLEGELGRLVEEVEAQFGVDDARRMKVEATFDLTDPESAAAVSQLLTGANPDTGEAVDKVEAAGDLLARSDEGVVVTAATYKGESMGLGLAGSGRLGLTLGGEFGITAGESEIEGAWYREPGGGFVEWTSCAR